MEYLLLIDWDDTKREDIDAKIGRVRCVVETMWPECKYFVRMYRSAGGKGYHCVVSFCSDVAVTKFERWAAQVACGDDWGRAMHNLKRIKAGVKEWNVLFETKLEKL